MSEACPKDGQVRDNNDEPTTRRQILDELAELKRDAADLGRRLARLETPATDAGAEQ